MKFLLQVTSNHMNALDGLLDVYKELGESLPIVEHYANQLQNKNIPHLQQIIECIFSDIIKFHHKAYKFFKQRGQFTQVSSRIKMSIDANVHYMYSLETTIRSNLENLQDPISVYNQR